MPLANANVCCLSSFEAKLILGIFLSCLESLQACLTNPTSQRSLPLTKQSWRRRTPKWRTYCQLKRVCIAQSSFQCTFSHCGPPLALTLPLPLPLQSLTRRRQRRKDRSSHAEHSTSFAYFYLFQHAFKFQYLQSTVVVAYHHSTWPDGSLYSVVGLHVRMDPGHFLLGLRSQCASDALACCDTDLHWMSFEALLWPQVVFVNLECTSLNMQNKLKNECLPCTVSLFIPYKWLFSF